MADTTVALPDAYARWLDAVAADPSAAIPAPSVADLLDALGAENPRIKAIATLLAMRSPAAEEADPAAEAARTERRAHVQRLLHEMVDELAELRARNETLAAALGACPCWGRAADCARCGGEGAPGSDRVDLHLFRLWVAPAVAALRQQRGVRSNPTGGSTE